MRQGIDDLAATSGRGLWQGDPLMGREAVLCGGADEPPATAGRIGPPADIALVDRAGRYRRELHVHCYRMLASFDDAEDALQETMLRAWRRRTTYENPVDGTDGLRAWLYRIATNVCLDILRARGRQPAGLHSLADVPWLQPYPDRLLDETAPVDTEPEAAAVARETIELTFLAVIQLLPPRQRAVLILCDVLDWPSREAATLLDTSVAAVNSALQRARSTMREHLPRRRPEPSTDPKDTTPVSVQQPSPTELDLLHRYMKAFERGWEMPDLVSADIRLTMPPQPHCHQGRKALRPFIDIAKAMGEWRLIATSANRSPAAACYLRRPGEREFRAHKLDVLRIEDGVIAEFTTFGVGLFGAAAFSAFNLPTSLGASEQ